MIRRTLIALALWTDDGYIAHKNQPVMGTITKELQRHFDIKYFLKVTISTCWGSPSAVIEPIVLSLSRNSTQTEWKPC